MKKKVFISSTISDLVDARSEVEQYIESIGYEPVTAENFSIDVNDGRNTFDACLDAVKKCDMHILIIGSNYGSYYEGDDYPEMRGLSITHAETKIASENSLKVFSFVRKEVWIENGIYNSNKGNKIKLRHATKEVHEFINEIRERYNDDWIGQFSDSIDLKEKLRNQSAFKNTIIDSGRFPTVLGNNDLLRVDGNPTEKENEHRTILEGKNKVPYIESLSTDGPAECVIYGNTFGTYLEKSYVLEAQIGFGIELDKLKAIIDRYYQAFSEFRHDASSFCINQSTRTWFGHGPIDFLKSLEMQRERYEDLRKNKEPIHHREAACFIDETNDSTFYIHLQPNRLDHDEQPLTFDYVFLGLLFNEIPCCSVYNKFFEALGSVPNTIKVIENPLTSFKEINCDITREQFIIDNPEEEFGGWVTGIVCKSPKNLGITDLKFEKIIVNFNQYHQQEDVCKYKLRNARITHLPVGNFPVKIINYNGSWDLVEERKD